jgi:hypothetical protein
MSLLGGHSSVGRAFGWHSKGWRFDPAWLHQVKTNPKSKNIIDKISRQDISTQEDLDIMRSNFDKIKAYL